MARFAIVVFPGSNCDADVHHVLTRVLGQEADLVWHEREDLDGYDAVILPGGFSYGDYLRAGAIARFSPAMRAVVRLAAQGRPVVGICNGFQILCEAGLLPGALRRNAALRFVCRPCYVRVETDRTPLTAGLRPGEVLRLEVAHGEGNYYAPSELLAELEARGQVVLRYADERGEPVPEANPNGSVHHIAGVCNAAGNVVGLMPHPERCAEAVLGSEDGRRLLASLVAAVEAGWAARGPAGGAVTGRPAPRATVGGTAGGGPHGR